MTENPTFLPDSNRPGKPEGTKGKIKKIKLLAMDVDGVLTDGRTFYDDNGVEGMFFSVQDGSAIKWLHRAGLQTAVITGRDSGALKERIKALSIPYVFKDIKVKMEAYQKLKQQSGLEDKNIAYVGDDLHDLPVLRRAGFSCAVINAREEVKKQADFVTNIAGGHGAVREIAELLLKELGKWDEVTQRYFAN